MGVIKLREACLRKLCADVEVLFWNVPVTAGASFNFIVLVNNSKYIFPKMFLTTIKNVIRIFVELSHVNTFLYNELLIE